MSTTGSTSTGGTVTLPTSSPAAADDSKQPSVTLTLPTDVHAAFVKAAKADDRPLSKFIARFLHAAHLKHGTTVS